MVRKSFFQAYISNNFSSKNIEHSFIAEMFKDV
jgi:hypothetical protein